MMTDPIADMLTRIRNALRIGRKEVRVPRSRVKVGIAEALKREGFIKDFAVDVTPPQGEIVIALKFGPEGERVISHISRTSKPGRRIYRGKEELAPVLNGLGISILSTSQGILSDRECRKRKTGGEVICTVW